MKETQVSLCCLVVYPRTTLPFIVYLQTGVSDHRYSAHPAYVLRQPNLKPQKQLGAGCRYFVVSKRKSTRKAYIHLKDLHKHLPGNPSVQHRQVLERSEHISQLDLDVRQLTISILAVNHGLHSRTEHARSSQPHEAREEDFPSTKMINLSTAEVVSSHFSKPVFRGGDRGGVSSPRGFYGQKP